MRARTAGALAVGIVLFSIITLAQVPPRDRKQAEPSAKRFRLAEGQTATVDLTMMQ